jgi:imidazole glycerol-phosphate synthase subunit HisH
VITIVDYGLGNVGAFLNMYKRLNIPARAARTAEQLADSQRIILPGVGAFDEALDLLDASGMRESLVRLVEVENRPLLGVCVGMQILANKSDEGRRDGLGWVPGQVRSLRSLSRVNDLPLPHMGWNDVRPAPAAELFDGLEADARFYFLHSFYFDCADAADSAASVDYGARFACAVRRGNVWGVQFHPEKSHHFGAAVLKNFAMSRAC